MNDMKNQVPEMPEIKSGTPEIDKTKSTMAENWFTKFFSLKLVFLVHLFVYSSVNGLCLMLNLMFFNGRLWTVTVALGWLVGLATHYTIYYTCDKGMFNKVEGLTISLYIHLAVFITTNILLVWGNLAVFQGIVWVPIAFAGWGIGLGIHFLVDRYLER